MLATSRPIGMRAGGWWPQLSRCPSPRNGESSAVDPQETAPLSVRAVGLRRGKHAETVTVLVFSSNLHYPTSTWLLSSRW